MTITAAVPPIGQQTWTVHACLDAACNDITLDASDLNVDGYVAEVTLASAKGGWGLTVVFSGIPGSAETWSVKVVNGQGSVVTQGSGPVKWQGESGGCGSCPYATATIP